jgi:tRNA1(Val) A37 N6-methylase TrmN6
VKEYKVVTHQYKEVTDPERKKGLNKQIRQLKEELEQYAIPQDEDLKKYKKKERELKAQVAQLGEGQQELVAQTSQEFTDLEKKVKEKYQIVYKNAVEWPLEFPEVVNEEGTFEGFDVVIGNPPYLRISDKNLYKYFQNKFQVAIYRIDTYGLFIEKGLNIVQKNGSLCYICPNTFLTNLQYQNLRKLLLEYELNELIDFKFQVFDDANVDTVILRVTAKQNEGENQLRITKVNQPEDIKDYSNTRNIRYIPQINFDSEIFNINTTKKESDLLKKIKKQGVRLDEICKIRNGINPGYPESRKKLLIKRPEEGVNPKKRLDAKDIFKYGFTWEEKWIDYDTNYEINGGSLREESLFVQPKILVQDIRNLKLKTRLVATYDDQSYYNLYTLHNIQTISKKVNLKFILALLNSSMFNFFFLLSFKDIHIKPRYLAQLPIKIPAKAKQKELTEIVEQILALKKENPHAKTKELEEKIDQKVYELYGLTEEEVELVKENNF